MKFRARTKALVESLDASLNVASTAGIKDYENSNRITIFSENDRIISFADNGFVQLRGEISDTDYPNLDYTCISNGSATLKVKELREILSSFPDNEIIEFEIISNNSGEELKISSTLDAEIFQSLSTFSDNITFPKIVIDQLESVDNVFEIRRDIFNNAANRLAFARGFEDYRAKYKYWMIRASQESIRFTCGTGGRFAILDFVGNNISNVTKNTDFMIPCDQSPIITKFTAKINDENIQFISLDTHLVLRTRNYLMSMPNYDPPISEWPDEGSVISRKNKYRMATRLGDWPSIVKGIMATYNDEYKSSHEYHIADITINSSSKDIMVEAKSNTMKSRRKARISDSDGEIADGHRLRVESMYIQEAFKSAAEDDYVQWEFNDRTGKQNNLVILRFYATPDIGNAEDFIRVNEATGLKERFTIFIATLGDDI